MFAVSSILAAAAAALAATYCFFAYRYSYWKRKGVPFPVPSPIVGNSGYLLMGKECFAKAFYRLALPFRDNGYCGIFQWGQPTLLVYEPEMVKQIVCKDFSSFHDRGIPYDEHNDPLSAHLFNLGGTKWRNLRNKLTPTFTSGKMKLMFPLMRAVGDELSATMATDVEKDVLGTGEVNVSGLLCRYTTDLIGTCAFGIECHSLRDGNNEFLNASQDVFRFSFGQLVRFLLMNIHPKLLRLMPIKVLFPKVHAFFINLMEKTVAFREETKVERHDFVQLMMQLRDADLSRNDPANYIELTPSVMAAQGFVFFLAGLDNVSNTVSFCLSRLAVDEELQSRVADEVRATLDQHDGELSYEALKKMELVERVLLEGLRLWSPVGVLFRKSNATTRVGDLVVPKGTPVIVVSDMMHLDPKHFPDPQRFNPDHHTAEARAGRHPYAFLPFGEGPRVCIAERFALLEMKLALAIMLRDFSFSPGPNYEHDPELEVKSFFPRPLHGFKLCATRRVAQ